MKNEHGFTLIETLFAISLVVILSATGLYGWDSWQQRQRLWQIACQVRDYLAFLRNDANRHNSEHRMMKPLWPEVTLSDVTPALGFYGLRDTAWAGHIRVQSRAGAWWVIVSNGGRIRLCNAAGESLCQ